MAEEQELILRVRLDDEASEGLANLQAQMRQLGSGPQAQGMERMRRGSQEAGGAVKQLTEGLGAFGQIATTAAGVATGILAAKVIDLGAAFVSSVTDFKGYADAMVSLSQQAYAAGTSMGQFQEDVDLMVRSGISADAAAKQITAFGHAWAEMGDITSETRQKLVAGLQDDPTSLIKMQQFLDEAATMTREGAMNAAREFATGIREYWREQGRPEAYGARWEEDFLRALGIPDLARVRGMFGEISAARRQLFEERIGGAEAFQTASSEIGEAWRDIKTSFQAILVDSPLVQGFFRGMASTMQSIARGMEYVEIAMRGLGASEAFAQLGEDADTWMESMGRQAWDALVDDFQYFVDQVGDRLKDALPESWHEAIDMMTDGIQSLIDDPSWSNLATQIGRMLPESWREAIDNLDEMTAEWQQWVGNIGDIAKDYLPESWHETIDAMTGATQQFIGDAGSFFRRLAAGEEFREALPESWRNALDQMTTGITEWVDRIKAYFSDPNWLANAATQMGEFLSGVAQGWYDVTIGAATRLVSDMVRRLVEMLPAWARRLLGIEEAAPAATQQLEQPAAAQSQLEAGPVATQMGGLEADLGAGVGAVAPAAVEAAAEAVAPSLLQRGIGAVRSWFGGAAPEARQEGGPVVGGQPYVVGERGPEIIVPGQGGDVASFDEWSRGAPDLGPSASGRAQQTITDAQFARLLNFFNPYGGIAKAIGGGATAITMGGRAAAESIGAQQIDMTGALTYGDVGRSLMGAVQGIMSGGQAREEPREAWAGANLSNLSATLDRAATQNVNVNGTGKISVDVNAPAGTRVGAVGEGLFKTTEITRQTQMMAAESGPLAATGIGAGAGVMGGASG